MEMLLNRSPRPTAIFAANDLLAIGIMQGLQRTGLRIPDDVAIVGFDDIPVARYVTPALTTIAQSQQKIGQRAAKMLLEHLSSGGDIGRRCVEVPYELKVRAST